MKTNLKNRIVSAVLALAMLASFLPSGLILKAEAALVTGSLTITETGTFTATFNGWLGDGKTPTADWGQMYFALVPDIKIGATKSFVTGAADPDNEDAVLTADGSRSLTDFKKNMLSECGFAWDEKACFGLEPTQMTEEFGVKQSGSTVTVTGKIPSGNLNAIYENHIKNGGTLSYVAFLRSGQSPVGMGFGTAPYAPTGLNVDPRKNQITYQYDDGSYAITQFVVNGADRLEDIDWVDGEGSAWIYVTLENLGETEIYITEFVVDDGRSKFFEYGEEITVDPPSATFPLMDAFSIDSFSGDCEWDNVGGSLKIAGNGKAVFKIPVEGDISLLSGGITGDAVIQVKWTDIGGEPQTAEEFTIHLGSEISAWDPESLTLSQTAVQGTKPAPVAGTLTWTGPDGEFEPLPGLTGSVAGTGGFLKFYRGSFTVDQIDPGDPTNEIKEGDTITDGEVVTVYFQPPSGKSVDKPGPVYTGMTSLIASGVGAALNLSLTIVAATADNKITVKKNGEAWGATGGTKPTLKIKNKTTNAEYTGSYVDDGNVWVATDKSIPTGDYEILANDVETGVTFHTVYGEGTDEPTLHYYDVQLATGIDNGTASVTYEGKTVTAATANANGQNVTVATVLSNGTNGLEFTTVANPDTNYVHTWSDTPTAGNWANASGTNSTWTMTKNYTGTGPIVLDPNFSRSGVGVTLTVNLDGVGTNGLAVSLSTNSTATGSGAMTGTTAGGGKVTFNGLKGGTKYYVTVTTADYSGVYSFTTPADADSTQTLDYYTVTAANGTGSLNAAAAKHKVLKGTTTTLSSAANAQAGYGGAGSWTLAPNPEGSIGTASAVSGNGGGKVTATANYTPNEIMIEVYRNGVLDTATVRSIDLRVTDNAGTSLVTAQSTGNGDSSVTFTPVPRNGTNNPSTYYIFVGGVYTGHTVSCAVGGTVTHKLYYYDVHFADVSDETNHGHYTVAKPASTEVLAGGVKNSVTLPGRAPANATYDNGPWNQSVAAGSFDPANSGATKWTISDSYTGNVSTANPAGITLTPTFTANGKYQATITVHLNDHNVADGATVTLTPGTGSAVTGTTVDGKVHFDGLSGSYAVSVSGANEAGTVVNYQSAASGAGSITAISSTNASPTLKFYELTATSADTNKGTVGGHTAGVYYTGYKISTTATAKAGYHFSGWTGTAGVTNVNQASGSYSPTSGITAKTDIVANFAPNIPTAAPSNLTAIYGTDVGTHTGITMATPGNPTGNYTYGNIRITDKEGHTAVVPPGLTLHFGGQDYVSSTDSYSGTNIVTVTGKPAIVGGPFTVTCDVTGSTGGKLTDVSFTITIGKYDSTFNATEKPGSGPHYAGDSAPDAVELDVSGPYYDGDPYTDFDPRNWKDLTESSTELNKTYDKDTLTGTSGNCPVKVTGSVDTTGNDKLPLEDVWTKVEDTAQIPMAVTGPVTVNVTLDNSHPYKKGSTIVLQKGTTAVKTGTLAEAGTPVSKTTVTLTNVPSGTYDVLLDGTEVATAKLSTATGTTVNVHYYTYTFHENLGTDTTHTVTGMPNPTTAVVLSGTKVTGITDPSRTGYKFEGWANAANSSTAVLAAGTTETTITTTSNFYAIWARNDVEITVKLNGGNTGAATTKVVTLVPKAGGEAITTTVKTNNVTTFQAVPAGTYKIYVDDSETNHEISVTVGGTARHTLSYYTVKYGDLSSAKGKYLAADNVTTSATWTAGEVLVKGMTTGTANLNFVTLPKTKADTNHAHSSWTIDPTSGAGNAPAVAATTWSIIDTCSVTKAITLTPVFTKTSATLTVTVKLNDALVENNTVVTLTKGGETKTGTTTNGVTVFTGLAVGVYDAKAGVDADWEGTGGTANIPASYADQTLELNYFTYQFDANKPDEATGDVTMPDPATKTYTVYTGTNTVECPQPTLTGYTFLGWGAAADQASNLWTTGAQSVTSERTYYAIWSANTVTLANMTAYGALNVQGIRDFTASKGAGTGHNSDTDFTYEVWDGSKWATTHYIDGITVTAGATLAVSGTPTRAGTVAAPTTTTVFRVRAVSEINGMVSAAEGNNATTITVTSYPTYRVVYDMNSGGNDASVSGTLPTDGNLYVVSDKDFTGAQGSDGSPVMKNTIPASTTRLTWDGGAKTHEGWSDAANNTTAANSFTVATLASAAKQNKKPGEILTLYAVWMGKNFAFRSQTMQADYNMSGEQWLASNYYTAPADGAADVNLTEFKLKDFVNYGTSNLTFTVTDVPDFMEFVEETGILKLKNNTRVGDATPDDAPYTIKVHVVDNGSGGAAVDGTITLTVHKTTPVITGWNRKADSTGPYYAGDRVWDETVYTNVHDPYQDTKILETSPSETHWSDVTQKFTAGTKTYNYTYTPADSKNYNVPPQVSVEFEAVNRTIGLKVKDNNKKTDNDWAVNFTNGLEQNFTAGADDDTDWTEIKVNIQNPATSNSQVDTITSKQDSTDAAFKDMKVETVTNLATGTDELILTFKVRTKGAPNGTHTLKYTFTGAVTSTTSPAGPVEATYTYTLNVGSSSLAKVEPLLEMVESTTDHTGPFAGTDRNGNAVNTDKGGLHLSFPAIAQESEADKPVEKYIVTLTGNGVTRTEEIPATGADHYYFWWPVDDKSENDLNPTENYSVTVQAVAKPTSNYTSSTSDADEEYPGRKLLTIDMITKNLTDMTFSGAQQSSSSKFGVPNGIDDKTIQVSYSDDPAGDNKQATKLHVNMTKTATDPALTSDTLDHDYYIWVYVPRSTYYLALEDGYGTATPVAYNTRTVAKNTTVKGSTRSTRTSPHENWEIVQAQATMTTITPPSGKQTGEAVDVLNGTLPNTSYGSGTTGEYKNAQGYTTDKYDIKYYLRSITDNSGQAATDPVWSAKIDQEIPLTGTTGESIQSFIANVGARYKFEAVATYKDTTDNQFRADVSEVTQEFTYAIGARSIKSIDLLRFEAVNGTVGTDKDTDANKTEDREVVYGNAVPVGAIQGYYAADDNSVAKQMRLDGLKVIVTYSNNTKDEYIVGDDTKPLPADFAWVSSTHSTAEDPAITDKILTFKGAGISTKLSIKYTVDPKIVSNTVTFEMDKRPLPYTITVEPPAEKVWNGYSNDSTVNPNRDRDRNGNPVKVNTTVTDVMALADNVTINPNGYKSRNPANTADDATAGKDRVVVAKNAQPSGGFAAFYRTGAATNGKIDIYPSRVVMVDVALTEPSANTLNNENKLSNKRYTPNTNTRRDQENVTRDWSIPVISTKWEAWDEATSTWVEETDHFSIDTVYRATVVVEADTNHYMSEDEIDNYTIRGKKNGDYAIEDLDEWNNREENKVTVTVDQSGPFHPDWAPDELLYHNRTTFTYVFHTFETPSLQFSDEKASFDPAAPSTGTDHEPSSYVHHTESVNEGAGSMTYTITVNAAVKDIFGAKVLMTNKELIDVGAELKVVQGNGTIDLATPIRGSEAIPMYKVGNELHEADKDLIIYELTIPSSVTSKAGIYHLEFQAMGSTSLENMEAGKVDVAKSYYTFTLEVLKKQDPPVISGGGEVELPVVTYWLSSYGFTDDMTAEKMSRKGAKPSFVPKITAMPGLRFLGWSEVDPATLKDGKLPTLVDPLTFSIDEDKIFYAVYERLEVGHTHYVIGFPDGTFGPDNPITRGQVATIIARSCLEDFVEGNNYGNPGSYTDVGTHWASSAIDYCSMKGVFTGYEDGTFRPDRYITRQELATVVARLAGVVVNEGLPFTDAEDISSWALNGVYTNYANKWVNGYEDGSFKPLNNITRAETVKIFNGYLGRGVDREGLSELREYVHSGTASNLQEGTDEYMTWPDVAKNHWAYYEVIEAANDHNFRWRDTSKAAPPEDWYEAFIDATWRYVDDANDGADSIGRDELPVFTVTYVVKSSGVTWDSVTEQVKKYESPDPAKLPKAEPAAGYRFAGWSDVDPDTGEVNIVDPTASPVLEDRTFYAIFEPRLTITYVIGDHGSTNQPLSEMIDKGQSPTVENLPEITAHKGWWFAGWSETDPATGVITPTDPTDHPAWADSTFYALYAREGEELPIATEPVEPTEPGETTDPTEPVEPTEPGETTDPTEPVEPTEPGETTDPTEPVEPTEPGETTDPTEPTEPTEPGEPVEYARYRYINGYTDNTFRPDDAFTRAAVATVIANILGYDPQGDYEGIEFDDLSDHWGSKAIAFCVSQGLMSGYTDNTFRPDDPISRQEFAVVLTRLSGDLQSGELPFADVESIAPWAMDGVYTVYANGWINGYDDGTFLPERSVTRAEAVKMLNGYLNRPADREAIESQTGYTIWSDVPETHWAYFEIIEASNNWLE